MDPTHSDVDTSWGGNDDARAGFYSWQETWRVPLAVLSVALIALTGSGVLLTLAMGFVAAERSLAAPPDLEAREP